MISTYASALLISAAAVVLGRGICILAGNDGATWLSPAVGFAALLAICQVFISLPGRAWTSVVAVLVLAGVAVALGRRRAHRWPDYRDGAWVVLGVGVFVSVPFLASGRVGIPGVSLLNDTRIHLLLAQGLRDPGLSTLGVAGPGYPRGPHAIAATFAQLLGTGVDSTLTGLLIATPLLTGLTALGLVADLSPARRCMVATLAGIPYMAAAWFIQGAFKEPIMALLMLGLVLALAARRAERPPPIACTAVPVSVLIAGVLYDFSYPGLIWPVAILVCWAAAELTLGAAWRRPRAIASVVRRGAVGLAAAAAVLVVLVAPDATQLHAFWTSNGGGSVGTTGGISTSSLADLAGPLRALEGLNVWLNGDFRLVPGDALTAGLLAGFALVVLVYAGVCALERRELAWPASIIGLMLTYVYVKHTQSPYVAAKALMVPAPLLVAGSARALMRRVETLPRLGYPLLAASGAAILYVVLAFQSSYLVLANAFVGPRDHVNELRSLRPLLHGGRTLALFYDDFYQWELLDVPVSSPLVSANAPTGLMVTISPAKPWAFGQPIDFDSVDAATLDRFTYVITTAAAAQSQPPPNFHLIGRSRSYLVFKRVGPTPPHRVLPESGSIGAVLDCHTSTGRRLAGQRGTAMVRGLPRAIAVGPISAGATEKVVVQVPPGRWNLSLPFTSTQAISVSGGGLRAWLPPNLDRVGELWPVGEVTSSGAPITLRIKMSSPGLITSGSQYFVPTAMIAEPVGADQPVPLRAACGRYVDWYTVG